MRCFISLFVFLLVAYPLDKAAAQMPGDIMGLFGTMINSAQMEAQRERARDAWSKMSTDLIACMEQHFSPPPQQLAEQGIGPYDGRVRMNVRRCSDEIAATQARARAEEERRQQELAAQQAQAQADAERRQKAKDEWLQINPDIIRCVEHSYSAPQQLGEQGVGPRDPRVARYVNRCIDIAAAEKAKAERAKAEAKAAIENQKRLEAETKKLAAEEAKRQLELQAAAADEAKRAEELRKTEEEAKKKAEAERAAAEEKQRAAERERIAADPKLQFLAVGAPEDLVAIVNVGPKAPHAVVDLQGNLSFADSAALVCLTQKTVIAPRENKLYAKSIEGLKVDASKIQTVQCALDLAHSSDAIDMMVLRRAEIAQLPVNTLDGLLNALANGGLLKGFVIGPKDVKAAWDKREVELASLQNAIETGVASGYGVVAVDNHGTLFCNAASELASIFPDLSKELMNAKDFDKFNPAELQTAEVDTDTAFVYIKKDKCQAVFAKAENLKTLINGLKRDGIAFSLDGRWIPQETITAYQQGKSEKERRHLQDEAEARQKIAAEDELDRRKAEADGKVAAERQQALRSANSARVTALKSEYVRYTEEFVHSIASAAAGTDLGRLHPELASWYRDRLLEGWEFVSHGTDVIDYGTTNWKGRTLEALVTTSTIRMRHRQLGEYKELCYIGAHIVDVEFAMLREPFYAACASASSPLRRWEDAEGFASKWNVEQHAQAVP